LSLALETPAIDGLFQDFEQLISVFGHQSSLKVEKHKLDII
jgi:hypothetical protein